MEQRIEGAITRRTKAIFTTHTLGNPVNIDAVSGIARRHGLWWLEDNCDALGSRYRAKFTGSFGDISTSSFYPAHQITMGEGGAVLTSDPLLKKIIVSLRDWGRDCWCSSGHDNTCRMRFKQRFGRLPYGYDHKYVYSHVGYNFKVTDMQAAIGVAQLKKLPWFIEARKNNFDFLFKVLEGHEDFFILPRKEAQSDPSWFGFPVLVKGSAPFKRADIIHFLEGRNIATRMLFGGNLIKQPAYQGIKYRIAGGLKNTDLVMDNLFWLGVYPGLTGPELAYTKKMLKAFLKDYSVRKGYKR
jgi:CDP-6-deoxy-D-xylo-4-hexulose-3-dehydrase